MPQRAHLPAVGDAAAPNSSRREHRTFVFHTVGFDASTGQACPWYRKIRSIWVLGTGAWVLSAGAPSFIFVTSHLCLLQAIEQLESDGDQSIVAAWVAPTGFSSPPIKSVQTHVKALQDHCWCTAGSKADVAGPSTAAQC